MSEFKNPLNEKDREDTDRISNRLLKGLMCTPANCHKALIECYLQEAVIYGRTGTWVLEEAANKITGDS